MEKVRRNRNWRKKQELLINLERRVLKRDWIEIKRGRRRVEKIICKREKWLSWEKRWNMKQLNLKWKETCRKDRKERGELQKIEYTKESTEWHLWRKYERNTQSGRETRGEMRKKRRKWKKN